MLESGCVLGDTNHKVLLECLIAAGYRFKSHESHIYDRRLFAILSHRQAANHQHFIDWFKELRRSAMLLTLRQICRNEIRRRLRICQGYRSILRSIRSLPLPSSIIEYLSLFKYTDKLEDATKNKPMHQIAPLEELVPSPVFRRSHSTQHVYIQFWRESCCCTK